MFNPIFGPGSNLEGSSLLSKRARVIEIRSLSAGWIRPHVCCANWKIAPIKPTERKRKVSCRHREGCMGDPCKCKQTWVPCVRCVSKQRRSWHCESQAGE